MAKGSSEAGLVAKVVVKLDWWHKARRNGGGHGKCYWISH